MGRRCGFISLLSLFVLASPNAVFPQAHGVTNVSILVRVRYGDGGEAHSGITVTLSREYGGVIGETITDSSGNCQFIPPKPDVYFVRATEPGYEEAVTRVDLKDRPVLTARLTLKPVRGQNPPPASSGGSTASPANDRAVPAEAHQEFEAGRSALRNGDADEGIMHLQKAIELHQRFAQAYVMLGTAYNQQKNWKSAQAALEKAIELDPNSEVACLQLGGSLNQLKDYEGAVKILNRGLDLNPESPDAAGAHFELAQAYFALGQWQDAEPHAAKATALAPEFARAHLLMGNVDLKKGDGQAALAEFQTYLALEPNGPAATSVKAAIPRIQAAIFTAKY